MGGMLKKKRKKTTTNKQNKKTPNIYFQGFNLKMTENALWPKVSDTRSMSSLHCLHFLHFSVSLSVATRASLEKNTEKCQETSRSGGCQFFINEGCSHE